MAQITDTSALARLARAEGFDPIEDRLRANIRGTIEAVFNEELNSFLGRLRYGRTAGAVKGCRHGNRDRQIIGTFGTETISVPRAWLEDEAGHAAPKPGAMDGWQTDTCDVEDRHTDVAGGVRVHNASAVLGQVGNTIDDALHRLSGGPDGDGSVRDKLTITVPASVHMIGNLVSGALGGGAAIVAGAKERCHRFGRFGHWRGSCIRRGRDCRCNRLGCVRCGRRDFVCGRHGFGIVCFARGTLIKTRCGERPIKALAVGAAVKSVTPEARAEIATLFPQILAPGFIPRAARPIPEKGKAMKTLAQRLAKNSKPAVDREKPFKKMSLHPAPDPVCDRPRPNRKDQRSSAAGSPTTRSPAFQKRMRQGFPSPICAAGQAWRQRYEPLQVERQVWRHGCRRGQAPDGAW